MPWRWKYQNGKEAHVFEEIVLVDNKGMTAKRGSTGKVLACYTNIGIDYIDVEWDRNNPLCSSQVDGGYRPEHFLHKDDWVADTKKPKLPFINVEVNNYQPVAEEEKVWYCACGSDTPTGYPCWKCGGAETRT